MSRRQRSQHARGFTHPASHEFFTQGARLRSHCASRYCLVLFLRDSSIPFACDTDLGKSCRDYSGLLAMSLTPRLSRPVNQGATKNALSATNASRGAPKVRFAIIIPMCRVACETPIPLATAARLRAMVRASALNSATVRFEANLPWHSIVKNPSRLRRS